MKTIAVLGADKNLLPFYKQIVGKYRIIGIAIENGAVCKEYCDEFYPISFAEKEKVLEICRKEKIDGITSFSLESALPTLIYVANKMGLVSNSFECLENIKDKYSQREAFTKHNVTSPKYWLVDNTSKLESLNIEYPVIVKPVDGGGSQGINLVSQEDGLKDAVLNSMNYSRTKRVIIEQFIEGREFSVESISHNGQHYILQITDKVTTGRPHFVEIEHHQPANVSEDLKNNIHNTVIAALNALKVTNSAGHTEIILTKDNSIYLTEVGARMGGGYISSHLVQLSTGYNFTQGVVELALNSFTVPIKKYSKYSGIYFYNKEALGVIKYIKNASHYSEIIETQLYDIPLVNVTSNANKNNGYFIYQGNKKFLIE